MYVGHFAIGVAIKSVPERPNRTDDETRPHDAIRF
jgi:hypothetical protein